MNKLSFQRQTPSVVNHLVSQVNLLSAESPGVAVKFLNEGVENEHWQVTLSGTRLNLLPILKGLENVVAFDTHRSGANVVAELILSVKP